VTVDHALLRPAEVNFLVGDIAKAREKLGWTPKPTFRDLLVFMIEVDLQWAAFETQHGKSVEHGRWLELQSPEHLASQARRIAEGGPISTPKSRSLPNPDFCPRTIPFRKSHATKVLSSDARARVSGDA
jgi:hypothetical protein